MNLIAMLMPAVVTAIGAFAILNFWLAAKYFVKSLKAMNIGMPVATIGILIIWSTFLVLLVAVLIPIYLVLASASTLVMVATVIGTMIGCVFGINLIRKNNSGKIPSIG